MANRKVSIITAALLAAASPLSAQDAPPAWPTLTDDWFGLGPAMRDSGVDLQLEWRQYLQRMTSGSGDHGSEYGGQFSLKSTLDLSKLGLWNGFSLTAQGLANYGDSVNRHGGGLLPVNSALFFPGIHGEDRYDMSALFFTQKFGEKVSASIGKFYTVEMARATPLRGGVGSDEFWHLQFSAPLNGMMPAEINGAMINIGTQPVSYTLLVFDPRDATNERLFKDLFEKGVTISGSATYSTQIAGRSGFYTLTGMYSTKRGADLSNLIVPTEEGLTIGHKKGGWLIGGSFQQYIYQDPVNPMRGWGIFGEATVTDGNPNPLEWSASFGVAGSHLLEQRPDDKFGIGVFHVATSRLLKDRLSKFYKLGNETGVEAFYTYSVTPWFNITADLQYVDPAQKRRDDAIFAGIGSSIKF